MRFDGKRNVPSVTTTEAALDAGSAEPGTTLTAMSSDSLIKLWRKRYMDSDARAEAAEARRDELEAALREIADGTTYTVKGQGDAIDTAYGYWRFREIARAALRTEAR